MANNDDKNTGMNPVVAAGLGVLAGAAVVGAGVAAVALDPDKHAAVDQKVEELKKQGQQAYAAAKDKVTGVVSDVQGRVEEVKKDIQA